MKAEVYVVILESSVFCYFAINFVVNFNESRIRFEFFVVLYVLI